MDKIFDGLTDVFSWEHLGVGATWIGLVSTAEASISELVLRLRARRDRAPSWRRGSPRRTTCTPMNDSSTWKCCGADGGLT
jgi:hypothetical protein